MGEAKHQVADRGYRLPHNRVHHTCRETRECGAADNAET